MCSFTARLIVHPQNVVHVLGLETIASNGAMTIAWSAASNSQNSQELPSDVNNSDGGERDRFPAVWPNRPPSWPQANQETSNGGPCADVGPSLSSL
jgi:hypothetical protein